MTTETDGTPWGDTIDQTNAALIAAAPDLARLVLEKEKEIARLRAKLSQTPTAEWFYNPDDWEYSYESPRHVIDCMDLQEAAPPPEPRVFYRVEYRPVFKVEGLYFGGFATKSEAQAFGKAAGGMVACVRVEITAVEGQYDD